MRTVTMIKSKNYTHQLLIAMPQLNNTWFERTVVYVHTHNQYGASGLVVNLPCEFDLDNLLEQLNLTKQSSLKLSQSIFQGGPMNIDHGFILHTEQGEWEKTESLAEGVYLTTSRDIVKHIALEKAEISDHYKVILGDANWEQGQLEQEIIENDWLVLPATEQLLFHEQANEIYAQALSHLGINDTALSTDMGHA
jgi:putative transcriptional regulator